MKVLIYGNEIFSVDMLWGFQQAGCEASIINPANAGEMEKILEETNPDLLITLGPPVEHKRDVLGLISRRAPTSMKYIHWDTDGISSTYYHSVTGEGIEMDLIHLSKPDLVLSMCPEMQEFIRKRNYLCEIMYYAYSPVSHYPMKGYDNDTNYISLIGTSYHCFARSHPNHYRYSSIKILLKSLLENGYEINFCGDYDYRVLIMMLLNIGVDAKYFHGYLPYEKTCEAYNSSFINLVTQNHDNTITKRTFEILGSGGFALSSDNSELRKLFVPGRDLAVSSSPEQTLELVRYYKENPVEWRKIRDNAVLSVQNHTYKQRAEYIIEKYKQLELK